MRKVGRVRLPDYKQAKRTTKCSSCGAPGIFRVRFEDDFGKVFVTLCEDCEKKEYEELRLQARFDEIGQVKAG